MKSTWRPTLLLLLFFSSSLILGEAGGKESGKDQPQDPLHTLSCRITLGDGRLVSGTIQFRAPDTLQLEHRKDGLVYRKMVRIHDLEKVEIHRWSGEILRESREGKVYEFHPSEYTLELKNDQSLRVQAGLFAFLSTFTLENENGKVSLFTFWRDFLTPEGKWHTGLVGSGTSRTSPHPDVVRQIEFHPGDSHP